MNKIIKALFGLCLIGASYSSNAALLYVEGTEVQAIDINESLESFYNFSSSNYSANTGFELANQLVAFFATDSVGDLGLYLIFGGPGSDAGNVNFDITTDDGQIVFVDDPNAATRSDTITATTSGYSIDFIYGANRTDGLIYSDFTGENWDMLLSFNQTTGLDGFSFLTFDATGNDEVAISGTSLSTLDISSAQSSPASPVAVNAPNSLILLVLSISLVLASRKRKLR
jgi:hypothetical protein